MAIYRGRFSNGVVKLEGDVRLPDGTRVTVETLDAETPADGDDPVYRLAELAGHTGVPDLAANIDHYLYGHPKVDDGQQ